MSGFRVEGLVFTCFLVELFDMITVANSCGTFFFFNFHILSIYGYILPRVVYTVYTNIYPG